MYLSHFGLREPPFTITPLTEFFYGGANRGPILEALIYAVTHVEGIIKVTGEVGSGKTMLCRMLTERLPQSVETIYLANPTLSRDELLLAIADELGLDLSGQRITQALRSLAHVLIERHAAGKRVVALVDEAHAMPLETLEELRLLSNLETGRHKLLQIVLFGQPELDQTLALPQMRQLKERITHHFTMPPLSPSAIREYLTFRLRAAGYRGPEIFSPAASRLISAASQGLTRRVNILADKALLAAFLDNTHRIEARHAKNAIRDCDFAPPRRRAPSPFAVASLALASGIGIGFAWQLWTGRSSPAPEPGKLRATVSSAAPAPQAPEAAPLGSPVAVKAAGPAPGRAEAASLAPASAKAAGAGKAFAFPEVKTAGYRLLTQRVAAAEKLFTEGPGSRYSIQLFLTNDAQPARMERFLTRAAKFVSLSDLYVCPSRSGGQSNFTVLYGAYASREAAAEALAKLPAKYRSEFSPILRRLEDVQATL